MKPPKQPDGLVVSTWPDGTISGVSLNGQAYGLAQINLVLLLTLQDIQARLARIEKASGRISPDQQAFINESLVGASS